MREFNFNLIDQPPRGLRPDTRAVDKQRFLVTGKNIRGSQYGYEEYPGVTDPFEGEVEVTFPHPQLVRGQGTTLLLGEESISSVNEAASPWTATPITTYNPTSPATPKAITAGGEWHVADMLTYYYLFNGNCVVFNEGSQKLSGGADKVYVQDTVTIKTGCAHKGRVLCGGFDSSDFWSAFWQGVFTTWQTNFVDDGISTGFLDVDKNWILWSSIGGGDFPLWLFYPPTYSLLPTYPSAAALIERLKRNELGFMPMPFQGTVLSMKPLRDNVIVYGEDGIAALIPVPGGVGGEFGPTYGVKHISTVGISQRDAVGVGTDVHIIVRNSGALWVLGADLSFNRLGYEEYLYDMLGEEIRISYNPDKQDFLISSETLGFLFNQTGLYSNYQHLTSGYYVAGGWIGLASSDTDTNAEEALVASSPIEMSHYGLKMLSFISADVRSDEDVYVAVDYRYGRNDGWVRSEFVPLNAEGNARIGISALEFRVVVRCPLHSNFELDQITVRWQRDDIRYTRGPDVDPSVTRASE